MFRAKEVHVGTWGSLSSFWNPSFSSLEAESPHIRVRGAWKAVFSWPVAPRPLPEAPGGLSCGLTTPEPRFIHTMVRDGFPVQAQLKTASEPRSTSRDWGSVVILGPTVMEGRRQGSGDPLCCRPFPTTPAYSLTFQSSTPLGLGSGSKEEAPLPQPSLPWGRKSRQHWPWEKGALAPFVPGHALRALAPPSFCPEESPTPVCVGRVVLLLPANP